MMKDVVGLEGEAIEGVFEAVAKEDSTDVFPTTLRMEEDVRHVVFMDEEEGSDIRVIRDDKDEGEVKSNIRFINNGEGLEVLNVIDTGHLMTAMPHLPFFMDIKGRLALKGA